jgi:hypothetical protein
MALKQHGVPFNSRDHNKRGAQSNNNQKMMSILAP